MARRRRRQVLAATVAAVLVAAGFSILQGPVHAAVQGPLPPGSPSSIHTITLVTGDVVTVTTLADGRQIADVDRPTDAIGGVRLQEINGDLYVLPDEAMALVRTDQLDRRLFNVTDLIEMGYDDGRSGSVPLIATYSTRDRRAATEPVAPPGSTVTRKLPSIHGAALKADKRHARGFWSAVAPETGSSPDRTALGEAWAGSGSTRG
jgi:hypothetical protein